MKFHGAVIREQGVMFGVVAVKPQILQSAAGVSDAVNFGRNMFGSIPIVLMSQDTLGRATFLGRKDIAKFLSKVPLSRIPWREYTVS